MTTSCEYLVCSEVAAVAVAVVAATVAGFKLILGGVPYHLGSCGLMGLVCTSPALAAAREAGDVGYRTGFFSADVFQLLMTFITLSVVQALLHSLY